MAHYRILKEVKKEENGVITTVAMVDSHGEVVEFDDKSYYDAIRFVEILNSNTTLGLKYFIEKVQ